MNFRKFTAAACLAAFGATGSASAGTVVASGDEWALSTLGYVFTSGAMDTFVGNLVDEFGPKIHVYATNPLITGAELANSVVNAGGTYSEGTGITFDLATLQTFDAIMFGGIALSASETLILESYVAGGGNVYISAGTGDFGSAAAEAAAWNPFLSNYGIEYSTSFDGPAGLLTVNSTDPLFAGVGSIYANGSNGFVSGDIICCGPTTAQQLYAVWRGPAVPPDGVVPLPASGLLALAGLGCLGLLRRRSPRSV